LDQAHLVQVFCDPRNSLAKQYREIFAMEGVDLQFTDDGTAAIAAEAAGLSSGARGLRSIVEEVLMDTMYIMPEDKKIRRVVVNANAVRKRKPQITRRGKRAPVQPAKKTVTASAPSSRSQAA